MNLTKVLSISGKPGLFKLISQTKTGALVESLTDGKRHTVFSNEKISSLQDISIFTLDEDIALINVLQKIYAKEDGKECINPKSSTKELLSYMKDILPNFDDERVYVSDMRKLFSWYNILLQKEYIDMEEETKNEQDEGVK